MLTLPARDLNAGDYVYLPQCDGWHRVTGTDANCAWSPGNMTVRVNGGAWFPKPDTEVRLAFSGVELCSIDHNSVRKFV
jgi:hypothetical protein